MPIAVGSEALAQWSIGFERSVGHAFPLWINSVFYKCPKVRKDQIGITVVSLFPLIIDALSNVARNAVMLQSFVRPTFSAYAVALVRSTRQSHLLMLTGRASTVRCRRLKVASRFAPTSILQGPPAVEQLELVHLHRRGNKLLDARPIANHPLEPDRHSCRMQPTNTSKHIPLGWIEQSKQHSIRVSGGSAARNYR